MLRFLSKKDRIATTPASSKKEIISRIILNHLQKAEIHREKKKMSKLRRNETLSHQTNSHSGLKLYEIDAFIS